MKRRHWREVAFLSVPILLIGATAWWRKHPEFRDPQRLHLGKPRLEIIETKQIPVNDFEMSQGLDAKFEITTMQKGDVPVAQRAAPQISDDPTEKLHLAYLSGNEWREFKVGRNAQQKVIDKKWMEGFSYRRRISLMVNIDGVPQEVQEVRFRGNLVNANSIYRTPTPDVSHGDYKYIDTKISFDLPISTPAKPLKKSVPNRRPTLELVSAGWYDYVGFAWMFLRLRDVSGTQTVRKLERLPCLNYSLRDEKGKKIQFFDITGSSVESPSSLQIIHSGARQSNLAENEFFALILDGNSQLHQNLEKVKGPLKVSIKVSDGQCWPLQIQTTLTRRKGGFADFAQ